MVSAAGHCNPGCQDFLPPYRPELNRVEKLWHKMKYEWMAFKARSVATLEADVEKILDGFGSDYRMIFF